jgi:hypothetical protein
MKPRPNLQLLLATVHVTPPSTVTLSRECVLADRPTTGARDAASLIIVLRSPRETMAVPRYHGQYRTCPDAVPAAMPV